jgi:general secretion pathway protein L
MPRALNLDTLRDSTARLSEAVRSALGWWLGELGALIPSAVKTALGGRAAPIFVTVDTTTIAVADAAGVALGQFVAHPAGSLPAALAHRVAEAGSVILLLPDSDVLRRVIDLPLTAERELRAAMFFEIDRQTPFASDQTYHRYRVEKRDLARKRLRVALAVTPRATADAALNALDANGVSVDAVRIVGDHGVPPLDLLRRRRSVRRRLWLDEPWRAIAAAAALLLVLGTAGIAWHRRDQAQALGEEIADHRAIGRRNQALRDDIVAAEAAARFLPDKRQTPRALEIVELLSRTLPDDAWIFGFELSPKEVRIEGFAANVPALIERLQQTALFDTPQLRAPVSRSAASSRDRFDLVLPLKPGGS